MNQSALDTQSFNPGFTAQGTNVNKSPGGQSEQSNANETPGNGSPATFTALIRSGVIQL